MIPPITRVSLQDHVIFSLGGLLSVPVGLNSKLTVTPSTATNQDVAAVLRSVAERLKRTNRCPGKTVGVTLGARGFAWLGVDNKTVNHVSAPKVCVCVHLPAPVSEKESSLPIQVFDFEGL